MTVVAHGAPEPKPEPNPEPARGNPDEELSNASQRRLFMNKFPHFNNLFGNKNQQQQLQPQPPIIIITGGGSGTGTGTGTGPTATVTGTGTVPTATGTVTETDPDEPDTNPTMKPGRRSGLKSSDDDDDDAVEDEVNADEEDDEAAVNYAALKTSYSPNSQQYVITTEEVEDSYNGKATGQPFRVNLKSAGGKRGETITIRIPLKYKRFFQNGQKITLGTLNDSGNKKRVNKQRGNKNRKRFNNNNKNKNKRNKNTRIIAL